MLLMLNHTIEGRFQIEVVINRGREIHWTRHEIQADDRVIIRTIIWRKKKLRNSYRYAL